MNVFRTRSLPHMIGAAAVCLLWALNARSAAPAGVAVSSLSPTRLAFAGLLVDTSSAPQIITLTNTGSATLNLVSIAVTGADFVDFSQTNTCGSSVAVNATCAINVSFEPQSFGTRTANLLITSSASNSPQTVSLTGMGMAPAVSLVPAALSFSSLLVTTNAQQTVRLTNSGDEPLTISSIAMTGPFSENNNCFTSILSPAAECSINVVFTPIAGGASTGQMMINDDAFPQQQIVALSGTGANFSLALTPATNSVTAGQSTAYTVSVTSVGGFTGNVALACAGLPPGGGCSFAPAAVTVGGSGAATSTVTVSTTAAASSASQVPLGGGSRLIPPGRTRLLLCIFLLGLSGLALFPRRRRLIFGCVATAALLLATLAMPACSGGGFTPLTSTPPDTYRFLVTGTTPAGTTSIQNNVTLTIVVM